MKAIDYNRDHYEEVSSWFTKRKLAPIPESSLPKLGKIVPGVAAIFVYQTDSDICFLENCITNPDIPKEIRSDAINTVTMAALEGARKLGYRSVLSITKIPKIINQAERLGFLNLGDKYSLLWRNLWAG